MLTYFSPQGMLKMFSVCINKCVANILLFHMMVSKINKIGVSTQWVVYIQFPQIKNIFFTRCLSPGIEFDCPYILPLRHLN